MSRSIRITRIISRADRLSEQLRALHFSGPVAMGDSWQPAINVYAYEDRLVVCLDLAGVNRQDVQIEVQSRRLVIRGHRRFPERGCDHPPCGRILVMEIPDGAFARALSLTAEINTEEVTASQENGWLWITLPVTQWRTGA